MVDEQRRHLLRAASYLPVADLERAMDHFERVLGFSAEYVGGEPPEFAIVSRDGLPIMLRLVETTEDICPMEQQGGTWDVFFWVQDIDTLAAELTEAGADIVYGPIVQAAYGMREFAVRSPDGHVLGFGEPV